MFGCSFTKTQKDEIGLGGDRTVGLEVTEIRILIKTKNEIGRGGDPNSNLNFQNKNEIGLGGDRTSNLNFPNKAKLGLEVTEFRI